MLNMPVDEIKLKIQEKTNLSPEEISEKIHEKLKQLSGLISEQGAAHIIANELGVKLVDFTNLKIKHITPGMRNVDIAGRVVQNYGMKTFSNEKRSGKVGSMLIADESGSMRVTLWNDKADQLITIKEGDVVKIQAAYVRENNGKKELHLNDVSKVLVNPKGVTIASTSTTNTTVAQRKAIKDLGEKDDQVELLGTIVQVYDPRFFEVCSQCGKRSRPEGEKYMCPSHGAITPAWSYLLNVYVDDGSGNIRTVFFGQQAKQVLGLEENVILTFREAPGAFEEKKSDLLGTMIKVVGRVSRNQTFDSTDFIANKVTMNPDPESELVKSAVLPATEKIPMTPSAKPAPVVSSDFGKEEELYSLEELEDAIDDS